MTSIDLSMFTLINDEGDTVAAPRPEFKSWDDVEQCISHNSGQPLPVVDRFIELAGLTEQWQWFDKYKEWEAEYERIQLLNTNRIPDPDTGTLPDPYPLPEMPERPPLVDDKQWKLDHAALFIDAGRDNAIARRKRENIKWYLEDPDAAYKQLVNMSILNQEAL